MHVKRFLVRKNVISFLKCCTFNFVNKVHLVKVEYQNEMQYKFKAS
jgi:hypothetical protein